MGGFVTNFKSVSSMYFIWMLNYGHWPYICPWMLSLDVVIGCCTHLWLDSMYGFPCLTVYYYCICASKWLSWFAIQNIKLVMLSFFKWSMLSNLNFPLFLVSPSLTVWDNFDFKSIKKQFKLSLIFSFTIAFFYMSNTQLILVAFFWCAIYNWALHSSRYMNCCFTEVV